MTNFSQISLPLFKLLKERIEILEEVPTDDLDSDFSEKEWVSKFKLYANLKPIIGGAFSLAEDKSFGSLVLDSYYSFLVRHNSEIRIKMRIKYRNMLFEIRRIIYIDKNKLCLIAFEIT